MNVKVKKMTKMELRAMWSINAVFSLRMLGIFMVLPVLTTYGMTLQGANESLIGLSIGIYGLAQAIFQIPFGVLSDKIGRKPLIIIGLSIFFIGSSIAAITNSIWGIILGRILQGSGAISAPLMALLADLIQEKNHTKVMALIGISVGITFSISVVLGPIITHTIGLHGLFWFITMLTFIAILLTLIVIPTVSYYSMNREFNITSKTFIKSVFKNKQLLKLNFGIFCLHTMLMSSFISFPTLMTRVGILSMHHWKVYFITMLISLIAILPLIGYYKKYLKIILIQSITLIIGAKIIFLFYKENLFILLFGIQIFFLSFNIMELIFPSFINKESPIGYKGTTMGVYSTMQFIGIAFGGILGGWIFYNKGLNTLFFSEIILSLIWLIVSILLHDSPSFVKEMMILLSGDKKTKEKLIFFLQSQQGVIEVLVFPNDNSVSVKIDTNKINMEDFDKLIKIKNNLL